MTFLFKVLDDVPAPPQELIDAVDRQRRPGMSEIGYFHERRLKNWNGFDLPAGVNTRQAYPEFEAWVKQNVTRHIVDAGVNYVSIENTGVARSTGAHTDGVRAYVMLWDIELGGPDAELCYWQEKGQPVHRPPKTQGEDLTQLELLDKIRLPRGKWTLVNTTVLHSVENLFETRITLHISLLNDLAVATVAGIGDVSFLKD
jgi:hypothetical protein